MGAGLNDKNGKTIATVSADGTSCIDTTVRNNIAIAPVPTVCRNVPRAKNANAAYQTEAQMEEALIAQLDRNGIRYEPGITNEDALIVNFRARIESVKYTRLKSCASGC